MFFLIPFLLAYIEIIIFSSSIPVRETQASYLSNLSSSKRSLSVPFPWTTIAFSKVSLSFLALSSFNSIILTSIFLSKRIDVK